VLVTKRLIIGAAEEQAEITALLDMQNAGETLSLDHARLKELMDVYGNFEVKGKRLRKNVTVWCC